MLKQHISDFHADSSHCLYPEQILEVLIVFCAKALVNVAEYVPGECVLGHPLNLLGVQTDSVCAHD